MASFFLILTLVGGRMAARDDCKPFFFNGQATACAEEFAPLPAIAMRVLEMVVDPGSRTKDLESVIQGDVSLVAAILKLANSAFYGFRRKVSSLHHALVLIGKTEVQSLVLSRVMLRSFKVPEGQQKMLMVGVWQHSLECALAGECIADYCGAEEPGYFIAGMLHDIGRLVVIQKYLKAAEDLVTYGMLIEGNSMKEEMEFLGCGHNELGSQLLRRWMFPPQLVEMVREHHDYDGIGFRGRSTQVLILADLLCRLLATKNPRSMNPERERMFQGLLLRCGADSGIIQDEVVLAEIEELYSKRLEERAELIALLQM